MLFMNDEVADDGGREQARHGEDVRDGVDVFVGVEGGEEARGNSWTSASPGRVSLFPMTDMQRGQGESVAGMPRGKRGESNASSPRPGVEHAHRWRLNDGQYARCNPDRQIGSAVAHSQAPRLQPAADERRHRDCGHTYFLGRPPSFSPPPSVAINRHCPHDLDVWTDFQPSHRNPHMVSAEVTFSIFPPHCMSHGDKTKNRPFAPHVVPCSEDRLWMRMIRSGVRHARLHWLPRSWCIDRTNRQSDSKWVREEVITCWGGGNTVV